MKQYNFWKALSNIAAYTVGAIGIIHYFFREYIVNIIRSVWVIEILLVICVLVAELMKMIIKNKKS